MLMLMSYSIGYTINDSIDVDIELFFMHDQSRAFEKRREEEKRRSTRKRCEETEEKGEKEEKTHKHTLSVGCCDDRLHSFVRLVSRTHTLTSLSSDCLFITNRRDTKEITSKEVAHDRRRIVILRPFGILANVRWSFFFDRVFFLLFRLKNKTKKKRGKKEKLKFAHR